MTTEQMRAAFEARHFDGEFPSAVEKEKALNEFALGWQAAIATQQAAQPVAVSPSLAFQVAQRIYSETPNDAMPEPQILLTGSELVRLVAFFATPHLPQVAEAGKLVPQWLPIETAPKDGTAVLVIPSSWPERACSTARFDSDKYAKKPKPYWERDDCFGKSLLSRERPPTHWMPLPAAPVNGIGPEQEGA